MRRLAFLLMLVLTFSVCTFASNPGHAADVLAVATGNWVDASTWNTGIPTLSDYAYIDGGYTVSIAGTDAAVATIVRLGHADDQQIGYLTQDGGTLDSTYLQVGYLGTGTYTLTDGTVDLSSYVLVGSGTYANGTVNQSGGSITTGDDIVVGKYGTGAYTLSGGSPTGTSAGSDLIVGHIATGKGTFNQYAGTTVSLGEFCWLGYAGTAVYNIHGGSFSVGTYIGLGYATAGSSGTINQSGGTITSPNDLLVGRAGTGVYNMTGGSYNGSGTGSDLIMGYLATGNATFQQDAGTVTLGQSVWLGNSGTAVYNMTDGSLTVGTFISLGKGSTGSGTVNQSGGTITAGDDILVGHYGTGEYNMTGGSLSATGVGSDLLIGVYGATGTFNQSAGTTIDVNEHVFVGYNGPAEYNMTGGSLSVTGSLYVGHYGASVGTLNQSSGTLSVTDTAWITDYSTSTGTYTLSADAIAIFASDLNVCAALGYDETSNPAGATGTLNIIGEDVDLSVGGNLVATGGSVVDTEGVWVNSSIFNFTTGTTGDVSTIDVTGYADIDCAVFNIIETDVLARGTVLDLIEADGGISHFASTTLGAATSSDWILQLGGSNNEILQAIKVPEPSSILLAAIGALMACGIRRRK